MAKLPQKAQQTGQQKFQRSFEQATEFAGGVIVCIDPGANTGIVCVDVPPSLEMERGTWIGSATVRPPTSSKLSHPESDREHSRRIRATIESFCPALVVFEEPLDGQASWRGAGFQKKQSRDTAFRLGQYYGAAVSAVPDSVSMVSYPVTDFQKRAGWMRRQSHATVELRARSIVSTIQGAPNHMELTDHELMAVGVGAHHMAILLEAAKLRRIEARRGRPL